MGLTKPSTETEQDHVAESRRTACLADRPLSALSRPSTDLQVLREDRSYIHC